MANTNRCSDSNSCAHPNVRCNAYHSARANIRGYAHSDRDPYANGHRDTHPNLGANTHANLHTDTHADAHANLHTNTHADAHANLHTDTHANTRTWKPRCDRRHALGYRWNAVGRVSCQVAQGHLLCGHSVGSVDARLPLGRRRHHPGRVISPRWCTGNNG